LEVKGGAAMTLEQVTSILAHQRAKKKAIDLLRAKGKRVSDFSCRELSLMATNYFTEHREELTASVRPLAEQILRKR
jgi:hypothetical protein